MEIYFNTREHIEQNQNGITNKYESLVVLGLTFMLQFIADSGTFHDNSICKY